MCLHRSKNKLGSLEVQLDNQIFNYFNMGQPTMIEFTKSLTHRSNGMNATQGSCRDNGGHDDPITQGTTVWRLN